MFSFKKADVSEISEVQKIAYQTWPTTYEALLGREQVSYMLALIYSESALQKQFMEGHLFYFIYQDDCLAGFASFGEVDINLWKLFKIYILPQMQGTGAGKALLNFIIKKVIPLGAMHLTLNVNRHNEARFFYEKNGFIIMSETKINIGNGYYMDDYVMTLPLQDYK